MTVLPWRRHTRAALLRHLDGQPAVGLDLGGPPAAPPDPTAQHLADARLAVPLPRADPASTRPHYRAEGSTVWHTREDCPAFPAGDRMELIGDPMIGFACRECARLGG